VCLPKAILTLDSAARCVVLTKGVAFRIGHMALLLFRRASAARARALVRSAARRAELESAAHNPHVAAAQRKRSRMPQQAEAELLLETFAGTEHPYQELCGLAGLILVFGAAAPGTLAIAAIFLLFKLKHECAELLFASRRPRVVRTRGNRAAQSYLDVAALMGNILIPTMLAFSFVAVSQDLIGNPDCPIQYVCYHDSTGVLRYNSTLPEYRWRVHPSDSNRHWLSWSLLVALALSVRVTCSMLLQNPSYYLRAVANEQRWVCSLRPVPCPSHYLSGICGPSRFFLLQ
jgi:hypothetical protein